MQKPVERPHTQRSHRQQLDALRAQSPLHRRRLDAVGEPPGEQQQHRARGETAQRERERARRRCVEPLHVVDCQQHRAAFAEHVQHVTHRDAEGAVVDGSSAASSCSNATSSARRLGIDSSGATSARTSSKRSPRPTCARPRSASAGRDESTTRPRSRAAATPSSQSVDLPIPASPSSTSPAAPSGGLPTKAWTEASSRSLPTISDGIFDWIVPGDAADGNRRTRCVDCSRGGTGGSRAGWGSARSSRSCSPSGRTTLCTACSGTPSPRFVTRGVRIVAYSLP